MAFKSDGAVQNCQVKFELIQHLAVPFQSNITFPFGVIWCGVP